jgi:hypothetical protein
LRLHGDGKLAALLLRALLLLRMNGLKLVDLKQLSYADRLAEA